MSNRLLHGRLLGRRPTTEELVRLIPPNRESRRDPDCPARLICHWITDDDGRLVCVWERSRTSLQHPATEVVR